MLNFGEFEEFVKKEIKETLPEEYRDAEVTLNTVKKNNGVSFSGLTVKLDTSAFAPTIYLEGYFKEYQKGTDLFVILNQISKIILDNFGGPREFPGVDEDFGDKFMDFEFVKDKIIAVLVNTEKNKELLSEAPHDVKEDLALVYKVYLGTSGDSTGTVTIKNPLLKIWGVTAEEIRILAIENTKKLFPATVQTMEEVLKSTMPSELADIMFPEDMPADQQMYIVSNAERMNGAISILFDGILAGLAEKIGTDLFVLPSSVHECIVISTNMGAPESFSDMVREINGSAVSEEEQLSDHAYYYNAEKKTLTIA